MQRIHTLGRQCRGRGGHESMMVDHDGMADGVDAASAGTSGQLCELAGSQTHVTGAVELLQLLNHHAACRHIDAQRQRFRGEHHFDEALFKQALDNLAEQGDHAGMM